MHAPRVVAPTPLLHHLVDSPNDKMPKKKSKPSKTGHHASKSTGPLPSVKDSTTFFITSINEPHNPTHCGRCLYGALLVSNASPGQPTTTSSKLSVSIRKNLNFWNTLYHFLVVQRTDEEVERLLTRLSICECPMDDRTIAAYHKVGEKGEMVSIQRCFLEANAPASGSMKERYSTPRIAFIIKAFCMLHSGLVESGVRGVAKGTVDTWPTSPMDLVPFGADELVWSFKRWWTFIPDTIIYQVMARVIHISQQLILPSLGKLKFCHSVVDSTRELVDFAMAELPGLRNLNTDDDWQVASREGVSTKAKAVMSRWTHHTEALLVLFEVILDELTADYRMPLLLGCETKLMQLFAVILYISCDPHTPPHRTQEDIIGRHPYWCQLLFRFFHMHLFYPPKPDYPLPPDSIVFDESHFPPAASVRSAPRSVRFYIKSLHEETRCSAYRCRKSIQDVGKNFQRCARCQVVSYCGRECQTRAWREETYPHKRVCPILRRVIDIAGGLGMFVQVADPPDVIKRLPPVSAGMRLMMIEPYILKSWEDAGIPMEELEYVYTWAKTVGNFISDMPDGSQWTEGYGDYEELMKVASVRGPKREFPVLYGFRRTNHHILSTVYESAFEVAVRGGKNEDHVGSATIL